MCVCTSFSLHLCQGVFVCVYVSIILVSTDMCIYEGLSNCLNVHMIACHCTSTCATSCLCVSIQVHTLCPIRYVLVLPSFFIT
jgi:hypothetical protein